jgi:hypothetical protein
LLRSELAGRCADDTPEMTAEMALVSEAKLTGDVCD